MATVEFLGPINKEPLNVNIRNLRELKDILQNSDVAKWLESCAVAINDEIVNSIDIDINQNDKISLLPPVCGG